MSRRYDCSDPEERAAGLADAVSRVRRGELVVLPTDTVYGVGADAFLPNAVQALLDAKGRGREMPVPVLVGSVRAASALIDDLGTYGQDLLDEFWPGALTVVCRANPNLSWDLGDTKGTVAVRMPLHELVIDLLKQTGPLAVSSANLSGHPPARTAAEAEEQLGDKVAVYLDDGPSGEAVPSSIVDLTGSVPRLLRAGAISEDALRDVLGVLLVETDDVVEDEDDEKPDEKPDEKSDEAADDGERKAAEETVTETATEAANEAANEAAKDPKEPSKEPSKDARAE
ncbi:MAG TPA: L-threonylcarbamoyladenylate synthase [Streptosporangiaceae bacterium]|nr:L-threonylcarbamoyladenylate synthase [Streptosporangiaceae bacterium]